MYISIKKFSKFIIYITLTRTIFSIFSSFFLCVVPSIPLPLTSKARGIVWFSQIGFWHSQFLACAPCALAREKQYLLWIAELIYSYLLPPAEASKPDRSYERWECGEYQMMVWGYTELWLLEYPWNAVKPICEEVLVTGDLFERLYIS